MELLAQIAAFEGGELKILDSGVKSREVVLALPLNRMLVKMVKVPAGADAVETASPIIKAISPYPDEALTVACETVNETAQEKTVIAAALPESAADDIAEALDAQKLSVVRVDLLPLGQLRFFWDRINTTDGKRRLIKLKGADVTTLIVLDGDRPVSLRAVADGCDAKREELLSLLEAEDFNGPRELEETLEFEASEAGLGGVESRSREEGALNAIPALWSEVLAETRFKAKLVKNLSIAGGIWAFILLILFGTPVVYGFMTDHMKSLCREHSRVYEQVKEMKEKTIAVQKYSDHTRGALEIMKAISDRLPEEVTVASWDFKHKEGLHLRGDSESSSAVYTFKDVMVALCTEADEEAVPVFKTVKLGSLSSRKGQQTFDIELGFEEEQTE